MLMRSLLYDVTAVDLPTMVSVAGIAKGLIIHKEKAPRNCWVFSVSMLALDPVFVSCSRTRGSLLRTNRTHRYYPYGLTIGGYPMAVSA